MPEGKTKKQQKKTTKKWEQKQTKNYTWRWWKQIHNLIYTENKTKFAFLISILSTTAARSLFSTSSSTTSSSTIFSKSGLFLELSFLSFLPLFQYSQKTFQFEKSLHNNNNENTCTHTPTQSTRKDNTHTVSSRYKIPYRMLYPLWI